MSFCAKRFYQVGEYMQCRPVRGNLIRLYCLLRDFPTDIWRQNDATLTSMRRHMTSHRYQCGVISTSCELCLSVYSNNGNGCHQSTTTIFYIFAWRHVKRYLMPGANQASAQAGHSLYLKESPRSFILVQISKADRVSHMHRLVCLYFLNLHPPCDTFSFDDNYNYNVCYLRVFSTDSLCLYIL